MTWNYKILAKAGDGYFVLHQYLFWLRAKYVCIFTDETTTLQWRMAISSHSLHHFYCSSFLTSDDFSSSPSWAPDQQGSWFPNKEREEMCKLVEVLHKLQLANLAEAAIHPVQRLSPNTTYCKLWRNVFKYK